MFISSIITEERDNLSQFEEYIMKVDALKLKRSLGKGMIEKKR